MPVDKRVTKPSVIYAIRCKENGKVYVGRTQDIERRINEHWMEKARLAKRVSTSRCSFSENLLLFLHDFIEYGGEEAFDVTILEAGVSPALCDERERHWIEKLRSADPDYGYNTHGYGTVKDDNRKNIVKKKCGNSTNGIARLRIAAGITQSELARKIRVDQSSV